MADFAEAVKEGIRSKLALKDKGWWRHILRYRYTVLLWLGLNALDGILTSIGVSGGAYKLNPFLRDLSPLALASQKLLLTAAAVMWMAIWKWLWFMKWLNLLFVGVACWNIYQLIKPI